MSYKNIGYVEYHIVATARRLTLWPKKKLDTIKWNICFRWLPKVDIDIEAELIIDNGDVESKCDSDLPFSTKKIVYL